MAMTANLVQETCPPPGSGTVSLAGSTSAGFVSFTSQFVNGDRIFYAISDGTKTEIGEGVFSNGAGIATLVRSTVLWNSLGTLLFLNFTASVRVWNHVPAERIGVLDDTLRLPLINMPRPVQDYYRTLTAYSPPSAAGLSPGPFMPNHDTVVKADMGLGPTPYNTFTIQADGFYSLHYGLRNSTTISSGISVFPAITRTPPGSVGGALEQLVSRAAGITMPGAPQTTNVSWLGALNQNDVIGLVWSCDKAFSLGQLQIGGGNDSFFSITKLSV